MARVRRNVGRRSQWGAIATARSPADGETEDLQVYPVDGAGYALYEITR